MIPCTTDRPSPVPLPASLVVKNGSKIRSRIVSGIPVPVSETLSHAACSSRPAAIDSAPPSGIASIAFTARFMMTCSICPRSALIQSGTFAGSTVSRMFARTTRRKNARRSRRIWLRSRSSRLAVSRRANSSSCRVRPAPRRIVSSSCFRCSTWRGNSALFLLRT